LLVKGRGLRRVLIGKPLHSKGFVGSESLASQGPQGTL